MSEELCAAIVDFANDVEAACVQLKRCVAEAKGITTVSEHNFNTLTWDQAAGNRIGEFEIATKEKNTPEKFQRALNILNKANATISSRYHGDGYVCSYWLYGNSIYRQPLKET